MARTSRKPAASEKRNLASGVSTKKGGKIVKRKVEQNIRKDVIKNQKCSKCAKMVISITRNKSGLCTLCLKKDAGFSNALKRTGKIKRTASSKKSSVTETSKKSNRKIVVNSPINKQKTAKDKSLPRKSSSSTTKNTPSPPLKKARITAEKGSNTGKAKVEIKTRASRTSTEIPSSSKKKSLDKMSLRGKKRSYAELASGKHHSKENNAKKKKIEDLKKKMTSRVGRNSKPTVKASEWKKSISPKKVSSPKQAKHTSTKSTHSRGKKNSSPKLASSKNIPPLSKRNVVKKSTDMSTKQHKNLNVKENNKNKKPMQSTSKPRTSLNKRIDLKTNVPRAARSVVTKRIDTAKTKASPQNMKQRNRINSKKEGRRPLKKINLDRPEQTNPVDPHNIINNTTGEEKENVLIAKDILQDILNSVGCSDLFANDAQKELNKDTCDAILHSTANFTDNVESSLSLKDPKQDNFVNDGHENSTNNPTDDSGIQLNVQRKSGNIVCNVLSDTISSFDSECAILENTLESTCMVGDSCYLKDDLTEKGDNEVKSEECVHLVNENGNHESSKDFESSSFSIQQERISTNLNSPVSKVLLNTHQEDISVDNIKQVIPSNNLEQNECLDEHITVATKPCKDSGTCDTSARFVKSTKHIEENSIQKDEIQCQIMSSGDSNVSKLEKDNSFSAKLINNVTSKDGNKDNGGELININFDKNEVENQINDDEMHISKDHLETINLETDSNKAIIGAPIESNLQKNVILGKTYEEETQQETSIIKRLDNDEKLSLSSAEDQIGMQQSFFTSSHNTLNCEKSSDGKETHLQMNASCDKYNSSPEQDKEDCSHVKGDKEESLKIAQSDTDNFRADQTNENIVSNISSQSSDDNTEIISSPDMKEIDFKVVAKSNTLDVELNVCESAETAQENISSGDDRDTNKNISSVKDQESSKAGSTEVFVEQSLEKENNYLEVNPTEGVISHIVVEDKNTAHTLMKQTTQENGVSFISEKDLLTLSTNTPYNIDQEVENQAISFEDTSQSDVSNLHEENVQSVLENNVQNNHTESLPTNDDELHFVDSQKDNCVPETDKSIVLNETNVQNDNQAIENHLFSKGDKIYVDDQNVNMPSNKKTVSPGKDIECINEEERTCNKSTLKSESVSVTTELINEQDKNLRDELLESRGTCNKTEDKLNDDLSNFCSKMENGVELDLVSSEKGEEDRQFPELDSSSLSEGVDTYNINQKNHSELNTNSLEEENSGVDKPAVDVNSHIYISQLTENHEMTCNDYNVEAKSVEEELVKHNLQEGCFDNQTENKLPELKPELSATDSNTMVEKSKIEKSFVIDNVKSHPHITTENCEDANQISNPNDNVNNQMDIKVDEDDISKSNNSNLIDKVPVCPVIDYNKSETTMNCDEKPSKTSNLSGSVENQIDFKIYKNDVTKSDNCSLLEKESVCPEMDNKLNDNFDNSENENVYSFEEKEDTDCISTKNHNIVDIKEHKETELLGDILDDTQNKSTIIEKNNLPSEGVGCVVQEHCAANSEDSRHNETCLSDSNLLVDKNKVCHEDFNNVANGCDKDITAVVVQNIETNKELSSSSESVNKESNIQECSESINMDVADDESTLCNLETHNTNMVGIEKDISSMEVDPEDSTKDKSPLTPFEEKISNDVDKAVS